jgi:cytidylate kinase
VTSDQIRLVTISAQYGAGGSVVGPALAHRLGVPFLQRATTSAGGIQEREQGVERLSPEEEEMTPIHRLLASLIQAAPVGPTQSPPPSHLDDSLRHSGEHGIHHLAQSGAGVVLGRGAAVVLGKGRGFHVRLYGPRDRRIVQGAVVEGISQEQARRHMDAADRARDAYVRRLYRCDPADPHHYHLMIDSTALPLDTVVDVIVRALAASPAPVPPPRDTVTAAGQEA